MYQRQRHYEDVAENQLQKQYFLFVHFLVDHTILGNLVTKLFFPMKLLKYINLLSSLGIMYTR